MAISLTDRAHLTRNLIWFALPLMASGIVQQSFNSVGVAIIGHYAGSEDLAAVGSNGPVIGLIVNLFIGVAVGVNVVIATYIGQRNAEGVRRAVATAGVIAAVSGLVLMLFGLFVATPILRMMNVPDVVLAGATRYLRIYSLGLPFLLIYNFASAVLRSVGDTKRPFYWLILAAFVNAGLDFLFVAVMGMGVTGVALGTVFGAMTAAAGVVYTLTHEKSDIRLNFKAIKLYKPQLAKILQIGVPAGVQGAVFALSNVFIQSAVNTFGPHAMAGSAAAINFEFYCYFVISAFAQAATAFVSQNYGAGQKDVCRMVFRRCLLIAMVACGTLNGLIALFHTGCITIFTTEPHAVQFATERILTALAFQWMASSYEIPGACMRAVGYSMVPTLITILGTCVMRVCWVSLAHFETFPELLRIYPITWLFTGLAVLTAWFIIARKTLRT